MNGLTEALAASAGVLGFIVLIGFTIEKLTEKFFKPLIGLFTNVAVADYVALVFGLGVSIGFQIDVLTPLAVSVGLEPLTPWFGLVVTGLGVGGGANFWHDVIQNKIQK
jgi:hypothetical protein